MVGDLMASRWAFEAAMVAQFKDNEFEKKFYLYDKNMAESDYKKIYYIPELETQLDFLSSKFHYICHLPIGIKKFNRLFILLNQAVFI